jgi:hypothetical protein
MIKWGFLAFMITLSLTMEFSLPDYTGINLSQNNEVLLNVWLSLDSDVFVVTIIFVMIFALLIKVDSLVLGKISFRKCKLFYIVCLMIGGVWLSAKSFMIDNTLEWLHATAGQFIKSLIYYIGSVSLLVLIGKVLYVLVKCRISKTVEKGSSYSRKYLGGGIFAAAFVLDPAFNTGIPRKYSARCMGTIKDVLETENIYCASSAFSYMVDWYVNCSW